MVRWRVAGKTSPTIAAPLGDRPGFQYVRLDSRDNNRAPTSTQVILIFGGSFNVIDNEDVHRTLCQFEPQPELLL